MTSLINRALLKEQLKRFWVIAALPLLAYVLFIVIPLYDISPYNFNLNTRAIIRVLAMTNPIIMLASVGLPLVAALALFSHMFNPKAVIMFNALPVSRKQMFFTNIAAGLILLLVPLLIFCLFLLSPIKYVYPSPLNGFTSAGEVSAALYPHGVADGQVLNTPFMVAGFFLRVSLVFVFYFAVFTLACVVAGHGVVALLLCCALPMMPLAVVLLDQAIKYWLVIGVDIYNIPDMAREVFAYSNALGIPILNRAGEWAVSTYYPVSEAAPAVPFSPHVLIYIATAAAVFVTAYYCHRARRQERTGESVVFNGLKQVLIFLLSVAGSFIMFVFFANMFMQPVISGFGFVLGFVVAFFVAQMIAEKTFNVGYKTKTLFKFGAVMAVCTLTVVLSIRLDLNGYQKYVPNTGDIVEVSFSHSNLYGYDRSSRGEDGWISDRDIIERTVETHRNIISDMDLLRRIASDRIHGRWYHNGESITEQPVHYRLRDGSIVSRSYYITDTIVKDVGLTDLLADERSIVSNFPFLASPEMLSGVDIYLLTFDEQGYGSTSYAVKPGGANGATNNDGADSERLISDAEEMASLFRALLKDLAEDIKGNKSALPESMYVPRTNDSLNQNKESRVRLEVFAQHQEEREPDGTSYSYGENIYSDYAENTINWLNDNGYVIEEEASGIPAR